MQEDSVREEKGEGNSHLQLALGKGGGGGCNVGLMILFRSTIPWTAFLSQHLDMVEVGTRKAA